MNKMKEIVRHPLLCFTAGAVFMMGIMELLINMETLTLKDSLTLLLIIIPLYILKKEIDRVGSYNDKG
ncbi:hypothetical protein DRN58_09495 [Thermococci archaeon]|nr:MAG: hypothetical protein DRN58_09495 [Thermococci archaeon]